MSDLPFYTKRYLSNPEWIPEETAWNTGATVVAVSFKKKATTWLLIVTVEKNSTRLVCFSEASTITRCQYLYLKFLQGDKRLGLRWGASKY